tara:strand:+ start:4582 stop:5250 length:669 start_codon:yes stop_codon:yes gene_type:complete
MEIIRVVKNKNYTTICNSIYKDKRISLKAKGLISMILTFNEKWNLSINGLYAILKEGKSSIRTTMNELIQNGYIKRERIKDEKGIFVGVNYIVFESPQLIKPCVENLNLDNETQLNNKIINYQYNKDKTKTEFYNEVMKYNIYTKNMLIDFYEYWSEPNKKGKMRKDMQKTWATSRRLKTWAKNESKWALQSVGISKVEKHLQTHNEAMQILKQIENDKKNK